MTLSHRSIDFFYSSPIGCKLLELSKIGERLRAIIPDERGEQKRISVLSGVHLKTLNKILKGGTQEPGFETIAKIAHALQVSLDDLARDAEIAPRSVAGDVITDSDRRRVQDAVQWLTERFLTGRVAKRPAPSLLVQKSENEGKGNPQDRTAFVSAPSPEAIKRKKTSHGRKRAPGADRGRSRKGDEKKT